jgi:hypothetical protein
LERALGIRASSIRLLFLEYVSLSLQNLVENLLEKVNAKKMDRAPILTDSFPLTTQNIVVASCMNGEVTEG